MKNKTLKLISKALLVIILATSVLTLSSCLSIGGESNCCLKFYSHAEFTEFVEKYTSNKQDRFMFTFVSFDLDDMEQIHVELYSVNTTKEHRRSLITKEEKVESVFDASHDHGFHSTMTFLMDEYLENGEKIENAYKITCVYSTSSEYNFYQGDQMHIEHISSNSLNYYKGYLCINNVREVEISIECEVATEQEKIDEIYQLFVDNIVIINIGGI